MRNGQSKATQKRVPARAPSQPQTLHPTGKLKTQISSGANYKIIWRKCSLEIVMDFNI